jgi:hypothetical protein
LLFLVLKRSKNSNVLKAKNKLLVLYGRIKTFLPYSEVCCHLFVSVQQSSFYGYTSMLPSRYTQAVMAGESKYTAYIDHVIVKVHQFKKNILSQHCRLELCLHFVIYSLYAVIFLSMPLHVHIWQSLILLHVC